MRPYNGRIDEQRAEPFIVEGLEPLPEPFPQVALFPTTEAVTDGIPVAELIGQVPPRGPDAGLVQDGLRNAMLVLPGPSTEN